MSGKNIAKRQTTLSDMELVKEYARSLSSSHSHISTTHTQQKLKRETEGRWVCSKLPTYFVKKEEVFVDDATGKVCVWRIEEFDKVRNFVVII